MKKHLIGILFFLFLLVSKHFSVAQGNWTLSMNGFETSSPIDFAVNKNGDVYIGCNKYNSETQKIEPSIFKSTNNGNSWSKISTNGLSALEMINSIAFNENTMFLAGGTPTPQIYTSTLVNHIGIIQLADFNIYPNPAQFSINIQYNINKMELFKITDLSGREIENILLYPYQKEVIVSTSQYLKGIYIYTCGNSSGKIVIQ